MTVLSLPKNPTIVVKVGSSSVAAGAAGGLAPERIGSICDLVVQARDAGARTVLVSSGAIAAGLPELGYRAMPADVVAMQAIAAVGQVKLMAAYGSAFASRGLHVGQVLLTPHTFRVRRQYLHARSTLRRLLDLGVAPVVNENDAVADDEIRFGENDTLAALVANLIAADLLVILTDQPGVLSADPRVAADATLIEEIDEIDGELARAAKLAAGDNGGPLGRGGMASKLAAARMAAWSGVTTVIGAATDRTIVADALAGDVAGTVFRPHSRRLAARKVWIAFAQPSVGSVVVDAGARRALQRDGSSLLAVGVVDHEGTFRAGDAIDIVDAAGDRVAKGLSRLDHREIGDTRGARDAPIVVHRDDLVVLDLSTVDA